MEEREREREEPSEADIWPITPMAELFQGLARPLTRDTFNQSALITPPL